LIRAGIYVGLAILAVVDDVWFESGRSIGFIQPANDWAMLGLQSALAIANGS